MSPDITFPEFVKKVCATPDEIADHHFRSQYASLINHRGEFLVDFIGRFENLSEDVKILGHQIGIEDLSLAHKNPTHHTQYSDYYDEELRELVAKRYEIDVNLFGYEFGQAATLSLSNRLSSPITFATKLEILKYKCAKMIKVIERIQKETRQKNTSKYLRLKKFLLTENKPLKQGQLEPYDDHRNIYVQKYQLLVYKIPKVASTTIWSLTAQLLGHDMNKLQLRSIALPYKPFYEIRQSAELFKVGFVRNPWDRLVSCYVQKKEYVREAFFERLGVKSDISFAEFVDVVSKTPDDQIERHARSQFTYLIDHTGEWIVDYIGRFEHFANDLKYVFNKQNIEDLEVPQLNISNRSNYKQYYTPELVQKVAERYQLDIELFGYSFDDSPMALEAIDITSPPSDKTKFNVLTYKAQKTHEHVKQHGRKQCSSGTTKGIGLIARGQKLCLNCKQ